MIAPLGEARVLNGCLARLVIQLRPLETPTPFACPESEGRKPPQARRGAHVHCPTGTTVPTCLNRGSHIWPCSHESACCNQSCSLDSLRNSPSSRPPALYTPARMRHSNPRNHSLRRLPHRTFLRDRRDHSYHSSRRY